MNKYDFVKEVAGKCEVTHKQAENFLNAFQSTIQETLKNGDSIGIKGFGTFKKVEKKARTGRNPKTGESVSIPAKTTAKFSFSKEFEV